MHSSEVECISFDALHTYEHQVAGHKTTGGELEPRMMCMVSVCFVLWWKRRISFSLVVVLFD